MEQKESAKSASDALLEVALQFGSTLSLERLLPLVLDRVTAVLDAERALFAILDVDGEVERAVVHNLEWEGPGHPLPVSQGLIEKVVKTNDTVFVADAQADSSFSSRRSIQALAVRFMVGVPVHFEGRIGGVLCVDSKSAAASAASEELELLTALARLVGTALENARLFEEQQFRMNLLSQMAHDFRVPLSVVTMNTRLLAQLLEDGNEEVQEAISDAAASSCRMSRMVENTLELARVESSTDPVEITAVDLSVELPRHVNQLRAMTEPQGLRLQPSVEAHLPKAWTVLDWVWIVLDNLVFNAIKHATHQSTVEIRLALREDRGPVAALERPFEDAISLFRRKRGVSPPLGCDFLEITVHNRGPAISKDLLPRLFTPFSLYERSAKNVRNTGLGLAIVDQCVRHLGGVVWVESTVTEGTSFTFTLPAQADA